MSRTPILLALALSCKDRKADDTSAVDDSGSTEEPYAVDLFCPGSAGCETADGPLSVGVAKLAITPTCWETWEDVDGNTIWDEETEPFYDCGCDHLCEGDEGYVGADEGEGDGEFQAVWMGGFDNAKPMMGVHDDLWARAIVFDQGDTRIALVMVDLVGVFHPDVEVARRLVADADLGVDHLIVASTHTHEGPDTMGLWGPTETISGVDPDFTASVVQAVADAVAQAVDGLRQVGSLQVGEVDVSTYSDQGVYNVITDLRDPVVIDEIMGGAAFYDTDGEIIASLAHFGDHPEATADENLYLTSDFPSMLRQTLETGVEWEAYSREGLGGTAIFVNGAVGGMMTSLRVDTVDPDGNVWDPYTLERTDTIGKVMGEMALDAIEGGRTVTDPSISVVARSIELPVENWGFQTMFLSGIIDRDLHGYDESKPLSDDNIPWITSEIDLFSVGPITFLTIPAELFPELNIGGYDGSHTGSPAVPVVASDNPNPPDLSAAPEGPYIKERVGDEFTWVVGLGNDEVGYVVPEYDFELHETNPWFDEAEGDHYEETNSLGPQTAGIIDMEVDLLLQWQAEKM